MVYLIDGYNLMHALGMAPTPGGASLERTRLRLLEWLSTEFDNRPPDVCVVFDGNQNRGNAYQSHRGIRMQFSIGETADDLIEHLIRETRVANQLTVISNDHRLQQAAQRKGSTAWTCADFLDWLGDRRRTPSVASQPISDKPEAPTSAELDEWLRTFGSG